ncbi:TetR/AcrR family transcriptional regulator [Streptomyces sp. NPDC102264]|uniref:TetR/AcrR family transcriptional regulator n=1 Tax=Streptomyces sp. NPDC102264 TaxID=3366149 RepID=UPI00382205C8
MTRETGRPLRADAERNRRLIMRTADRMIARRGAVVTLNEIAAEAGIGVATVYRRFPDLQELIDALFTERFTGYLRLAEEAAQRPTPGEALHRYLLDAARARAQDRAVDVILAHADLDAPPVARMRDDLTLLVDGLVEGAVAAHAVCDDFASADVYAFLHMIGAVADRTYDIAPDGWRRYAEVLLTGFGLRTDPSARTSAMTDEQILHTWPTPPA